MISVWVTLLISTLVMSKHGGSKLYWNEGLHLYLCPVIQSFLLSSYLQWPSPWSASFDDIYCQIEYLCFGSYQICWMMITDWNISLGIGLLLFLPKLYHRALMQCPIPCRQSWRLKIPPNLACSWACFHLGLHYITSSLL